jgi:flavin reductase (DIM6/NTAB) family NADH-FMN oxidoreductase RutF
MNFDPRVFRNCLSRFATGITVVTCMDAKGVPHGMTVNSFNSVSLDPPLILFSLARDARSLASFEAATSYAVNVLAADQMDMSQKFSMAGEEKWQDTNWSTGEHGAPVLDGVMATFECRPETTADGGDHVIFIGRVEQCDQREDANPLLYFAGRYAHLAED